MIFQCVCVCGGGGGSGSPASPLDPPMKNNGEKIQIAGRFSRQNVRNCLIASRVLCDWNPDAITKNVVSTFHSVP